jgi:flagellar biosynthesis anti-sigma factor FlgM
MKINESDAMTTSKLQAGQVYATPSSRGASTAAGGGVPDTGDNVELRSQASLLSLAQAAGSSENSANVERLRALVQSGQYQVDPAALSHSITDAALRGY